MSIRDNGRILIPKPGKKVQQYWLWSHVKSCKDNRDFEDVCVNYQELADKLIKATNALWVVLDPALAEIKASSIYGAHFAPQANLTPEQISLLIRQVKPSALATDPTNASHTTSLVE